MTTIPDHHDDITVDWLNDVLRSAGEMATVDSFERRPIAEGVGMMATIEMVDLTYSDGEGPDTVVVKLPATNEANLGVALAFDLYRREALFYRDLAERTSASTPRMFFADAEGPGEFALVMEDLRDYRLGDQVVGCELADAEAAVTTLARLHAPFWDRVDGDDFEFIPYETPSVHGDALRDGAAAGWDPMVETFGAAVPEHMRAVRERFLAAIPAMQEWLVTAPSTVVHGDFRMDNLFFGDESGQEPMVVIDWQGCLRSKGVRDIAYFLTQSVPTDLRREHERDLVERWRSALEDGGVEGHPAERAWEDYRRAVLCMWIPVVVIAGTLDSDNDRARAWMTAMIRRCAAAIEDLGSLDLLPEFEERERDDPTPV
ncbi:phosphotransferase [Ilumatobacter sp.]|uniref:phosphotransferase n=1 Tax=Ilumatobacter sp. TaxID=1967498 RepID=UPI003B5271DE